MEWKRQLAPVSFRNILRSGILAAAAVALGFCSLPCLAQNPAPKTNATVKSDTVAVHSQMDGSSPVVQTLKKGEALFMDFQIAGSTGDWCGVRLPGQSADLGYVDCGSLNVAQPRREPPGPASSGEFAGEPGAGAPQPPPAIHLSLSSPASRDAGPYDQIRNLVVHDDEVDTLKMEELDREAQSGRPGAMDRAALAHIAAAQFDLSESDRDDAIGEFRSAVKLAAQNPQILFSGLMGLAYVHLLRSEYDPASQFLERAQKIDPRSAAVAELLGWSDYGLNRLNNAVAELQKAQRLKPNPEAAALLAKVRQDQQTERDFQQSENSHFILRYEGDATPELAEDILNALEGDFETLQAALQFTPAQPIAVILYTDQTFRDVTRAPSWSGAINDGRIRIPVQGLTSVTPTLARELRHELTHSFVRQMTDGRCPTWLNEGLAQYFEGRTSANDAQLLVTLYQKKKYIPFRLLEGSWMHFPTPIAVYAYAWSLAAVESIIANSGMYGIERIFIRLKQEDSAQMALDRALQLSYSDLELQTVEYLQNTYLH
ncbi:MAG TPA: hypothetical protein VNJ12_08380 [Candidatus Dormibacteraeota bacterium]|nr:hypothetical protein [Candidatus Dormibacteraeota bacterium]